MVWHHAASTGIALVSAPQVHNFISFFFSHSLSFYFILTSILKLSFLVTYLMTIALFSAVIICCITVAQGWCLPVTLTVYTKTKTDPSHIPSLLPVTYCVLCFFYTSVLWFSHLFNLVIHITNLCLFCSFLLSTSFFDLFIFDERTYVQILMKITIRWLGMSRPDCPINPVNTLSFIW